MRIELHHQAQHAELASAAQPIFSHFVEDRVLSAIQRHARGLEESGVKYPLNDTESLGSQGIEGTALPRRVVLAMQRYQRSSSPSLVQMARPNPVFP